MAIRAWPIWARLAALCELALIVTTLAALVVGDRILAVKLLLYAMLLPGLGLISAFLFAQRARGTWRHDLGAAAAALCWVGVLLVVVSVLLWLPFAPEQWKLPDVPMALAVPMVGGIGAMSVGFVLLAIAGLLEPDAGPARSRARYRAIVLIVVGAVYVMWLVRRA